jgi:hypothetical protein
LLGEWVRFLSGRVGDRLFELAVLSISVAIQIVGPLAVFSYPVMIWISGTLFTSAVLSGNGVLETAVRPSKTIVRIGPGAGR